MADFRVRRVNSGQTKIRNVPIAVTPEGFWCCPSPTVFQKTLKSQIAQNKHKSSSAMEQPQPTKRTSSQKTQTPPVERKHSSNSLRSKVTSDDQTCVQAEPSASPTFVDRAAKPSVEAAPQRKVCVGFGQPETSDLKLLLSGKEGIVVKMSVHRCVLEEHSSCFVEKFAGQSQLSVIEIGDCEDVEVYVETIGLMYCKELKQRLVKQTVSRVLRILKVAESLGFHSCIKSCLEYLEAAPWIGDEEENVVSLVRRLQSTKIGVSPILKRVSSDVSYPPTDTLAQIMDLVLKSNDDKGRREMKSLMLKLLRENSLLLSGGSVDLCFKTLYSSCQSCLDSLLLLFRQAAEPDFSDKSLDSRDPVVRKISLDADNLLWLVEIIANRHMADEFAMMWASQGELANLHSKLPIMSRHIVSCITARIYVGIGRGELLPSKDVRQLLLQVWLQPLIDDYSWLQRGCGSFDRKVVEEGIGRTILTLPLEDQQSILMSWLGSFLRVGDNCPNLQRAFEVWWRRTFVRPYVEQQANLPSSDGKSADA